MIITSTSLFFDSSPRANDPKTKATRICFRNASKAARKTSGGGTDQGEEPTQGGSPADGTGPAETQPNP